MTTAAALAAALALAMPQASLVAPSPAAGSRKDASQNEGSSREEARRKEAGRAFADGERAWAKGDYAEAARLFARAQELAAHPDTLYNLGVAQHRAGDPVAAWHTFTELIAAATTKRQRREAEAARARLRKEVATIEVRTAAGQTVCVDDVPLPAGERRIVKPGEHVVSLEGARVPVRVEAGETRTLERVGERDGAPRLAPVGKVMLGVSIATALGAAGLGTGAGVTDDRGTSRGLAFGAAALATTAAVGTIVVLATMRRPGAPARPRVRAARGPRAGSVGTPASPCGA